VQYLRSYLDQAGFLPSVALVITVYVLMRSARDSMWRIALLALPGTLAHELMHLIVGFLLRAQPHGFSVAKTTWPHVGARLRVVS